MHTVAIELLSAGHVPGTGLDSSSSSNLRGSKRTPYKHTARLSLLYLPGGRAGPDGALPCHHLQYHTGPEQNALAADHAYCSATGVLVPVLS